jgi:hypothetical protein
LHIDPIGQFIQELGEMVYYGETQDASDAMDIHDELKSGIAEFDNPQVKAAVFTLLAETFCPEIYCPETFRKANEDDEVEG